MYEIRLKHGNAYYPSIYPPFASVNDAELYAKQHELHGYRIFPVVKFQNEEN